MFFFISIYLLEFKGGVRAVLGGIHKTLSDKSCGINEPFYTIHHADFSLGVETD